MGDSPITEGAAEAISFASAAHEMVEGNERGFIEPWKLVNVLWRLLHLFADPPTLKGAEKFHRHLAPAFPREAPNFFDFVPGSALAEGDFDAALYVHNLVYNHLRPQNYVDMFARNLGSLPEP